MTLLLACASPEGLILAGDTIMCAGSRAVVDSRKWIKAGGWHIGGAGSATYGQILDWNAHTAGNLTHIKDLVLWLRTTLMANGQSPIKNDGVDQFDGDFLVARGKTIYEIDAFLHVIEIPEGKWGLRGSGSQFARGALAMLEEVSSPWADSDVAKLVLGLAEHAHSNVRGCKVDVIPYNQRDIPIARPGVRDMVVPE